MGQIPGIFWLVPVSIVIALIFAAGLIRSILRYDQGTQQMQEIGGIIFEGAWAFLKRQYITIGIIAGIVAVLIGVLVGRLSGEAELGKLGVSGFGLGWRTGIAFLAGALCSAISGFVGMLIAVKSNVRCAAASHRNLNSAIKVALHGGAVSGFLVVALSLLGVTAIFFAFGGAIHPDIAPHLIVGFGFGASMVALFAQLGGGIYTKAADMGADLVGKIEAGIPEDDPRNPAVIADLVGDNVGDCAGRGADLFESTAAENIGAMILGIVLYTITREVAWILFPLVIRACGLIASIIGIMCVRARSENENPMTTLNRGYYVAVVLSIIGMYFVVQAMLHSIWLFFAGLVGILTSIVIIYVTQYYTEPRFGPVKRIANASRAGPATNIVVGMSVGFETVMPTALIIGVALLLAYWFGVQSGIGGLERSSPLEPWCLGAFGTAVATMGMLMTCPFILTEDTFGPITDNANGINQMTGAGEKVRRITDRLDAVGNTTKALTKGYAMVSAGLAAFLLFQAYLDRISLFREGVEGKFTIINFVRPEVFVGGILGIMLVFLFSSWAIRAVGAAASEIIDEVRRQFRESPGIMQSTSRPDYACAVDITARAALRGMIAPGLLVVLMPVATGVIFKYVNPNYDAAMVVGALLMVGTIGAILVASFMNNGGGAWDNAKKLIEDGQLKDEQGNVIGKGTPTHAAAVCGDTIGDPLKDCAGPSLHVVAKLLSTITLVMCSLWAL